LIKKPQRSESGIQSVSILTSPYPKYEDENGKIIQQNFSCKHNCYFCPNEIDPVSKKMVMPRSYLSREPACLRASRNEFDPIKQIYDRLLSLEKMGHPLDKLEIIVLGGTVLEYPREYLTYFTTQIFYICNIYPFTDSRKMLSLVEEQRINTSTDIKIIGYTLETRPDGITYESINYLRWLGVTRMQIGIQHTSNRLLNIVNRGHGVEESIVAIKLLKNSGLKVISHLMPDLPYATKDEDLEMFDEILYNSDLLCDEYKIYPCVATKFSMIKKWADRGEYVPNADKDPNYLRDVIGYYMKNVQPWVRIPRIIRDIPNDYIHYGNKEGHLREIIDKNVKTNEIRGREIRNTKLTEYPILVIDSFDSSGCKEYFIRYETKDRTKILGFCRLRLNKEWNPFLNELNGCALIRELHVYGKTTIVNSKDKANVQHLGLGKKLIKNAEWVALKHGYINICITSGIGVQGYYKNKLGYHLDGLYMKKNIVKYKSFSIIILFILIYIYNVLNLDIINLCN
jgi:ELP3 family radical SAM enzyme/protein acetyltransferase